MEFDRAGWVQLADEALRSTVVLNNKKKADWLAIAGQAGWQYCQQILADTEKTPDLIIPVILLVPEWIVRGENGLCII